MYAVRKAALSISAFTAHSGEFINFFTWFQQMDSAYLEEFREVYQKRGKYDLEAQIRYLASLAEDYKQRYLRSGNWMDCLKVGIV